MSIPTPVVALIILAVLVVVYIVYSKKTSKYSIPNYQHAPIREITPPVQESMTEVHTCVECARRREESPVEQFSDAIKRQDEISMVDPLIYPQTRLPRDVLEQYREFYNRQGVLPPFNQATQPYLFDNPIMNGFLMKATDENIKDGNPQSVPLFRLKSTRNNNRYFYYTMDQRQHGIPVKIPLDNICVNGRHTHGSEDYGIDELFTDDEITNIDIFPGSTYYVKIYKGSAFP